MATDAAAPEVTLVDFAALSPAQRADAAAVLRDGLAHMPSAFAGEGDSEAEVRRLVRDAGWLGYAALDGSSVVGWIGALRVYSHGWEIHPLVVAPHRQRRGVGRLLLTRLEQRARADGINVLYLGSDDDYGGTNLFGRELFPDVLSHAASIEVGERGHSYTFYERHGYEVVGVLPDVSGDGRPDILMAKKLT